MAQWTAAALALLLHAAVVFMSCVGLAVGVSRSDQFRNTSSKATLADNYRDYATGLVVFGDSTVDVGVNNYLLTPVKCNFEPYGRLLQGGVPSGRFCDGKIAIDFFAEKIGYPPPLPYLAPNAHGQAILTGINVASGASGWTDLTATRLNVKTLGEQLMWYKNWQNEVVSLVGQERGDYIIKNTLHLISTGANDYVNNYIVNPTLLKKYTLEEYTTFVVDTARSYIQELYDLGGRKIAVLGLPPLGCLPAQITLYGSGKPDCIEWLNAISMKFNEQFLDMMNNELKPNFHGGRLAYLDSYATVDKMIKNPHAYGISETRKGCCGSGLIESGPACNNLIPGTCKDASPYFWWDSFHPTEHSNSFLGDAMLEQTVPILVGPAQP